MSKLWSLLEEFDSFSKLTKHQNVLPLCQMKVASRSRGTKGLRNLSGLRLAVCCRGERMQGRGAIGHALMVDTCLTRSTQAITEHGIQKGERTTTSIHIIIVTPYHHTRITAHHTQSGSNPSSPPAHGFIAHPQTHIPSPLANPSSSSGSRNIDVERIRHDLAAGDRFPSCFLVDDRAGGGFSVGVAGDALYITQQT